MRGTGSCGGIRTPITWRPGLCRGLRSADVDIVRDGYGTVSEGHEREGKAGSCSMRKLALFQRLVS